jgi:hypothetical protein
LAVTTPVDDEGNADLDYGEGDDEGTATSKIVVDPHADRVIEQEASKPPSITSKPPAVMLDPKLRAIVNSQAAHQLEARASPLWMADVIMCIQQRQRVLAAAQHGSKEELDMRVAEESIKNFRANLIAKYIDKWQRCLNAALKEISDDPELIEYDPLTREVLDDGSPIKSTLQVEGGDDGNDATGDRETLKVDDDGKVHSLQRTPTHPHTHNTHTTHTHTHTHRCVERIFAPLVNL